MCDRFGFSKPEVVATPSNPVLSFGPDDHDDNLDFCFSGSLRAPQVTTLLTLICATVLEERIVQDLASSAFFLLHLTIWGEDA